MPFEWDAVAGAYWDVDESEYLAESRLRALALEERQFTNERFAALMDEYSDGLTSAEEVAAQGRALIKGGGIRQYLIGRGGAKQMGKVDYGVIGRRLRDQYAYFEGFMRDLETLSPAQRRARAQLYINATHYLYERGKTRALGIPKLPAYPGEGSECRANCKCHWEYRRRDGEGNWDIHWRLGQADHCLTCLDRERTYAPLKVRGGKIERLLPLAA